MGIKATPSFALKETLFNAATLSKLSERLAAAHPAFPRRRFERTVLARFPELELKQRIDWIVTSLEPHLPEEFPAAVEILRRALPEPLDPSRSDDDFGEFIWVVPGEYVARHGCRPRHLERSLGFLRESTRRFSAESALRPFLRAFPDETLAFVHDCATDDNYHVRRLASEGIRPFLPWAARVELPPAEVIAVLDRLHADPTRYVTRSVANTLNDISRIDPDLTITTLRRWRKLERQRKAELTWMTRHATRTLVKQGHPRARSLLGYPVRPAFRLSRVRTTPAVRVGEAFEWHCELCSNARQRLRVGLRLYFLKANGSHSPKLFAVTDVELGRSERLEIRKRVTIQPATTRTLYPGTHFAELVVNGVARGRRPFELTDQ